MSVEWHGNRFLELARKHIRDGVSSAGVELQRTIKKTLNQKKSRRGGPSGSEPGMPPGNRTGALSRSIQFAMKTTGDGSSFGGTVFSDLVYAPMQEFGGTVSPRTAKAIAIPIGIAGARAATRAGASIRTLDLDLIPRKGKPPLLVRKRGKGKNERWEILFVLLKLVRIPARPHWRPSIATAKPKMYAHINRGVKRANAEFKRG